MTPSLSDTGVQSTTTPESRNINSDNSAKSANLESTINAVNKVGHEEEIEPQTISSPQLYTSPSLTSDSGNDSFLEESNVEKDANEISPLPNGQARRHPLLNDNNKNKRGTDELAQNPSEVGTIERQGAVMEDTATNDVGNSFPTSPSTGFVPPVIQEDVALSKVPEIKNRLSMIGASETEDVSVDQERSESFFSS